jgi:hypothetical protein
LDDCRKNFTIVYIHRKNNTLSERVNLKYDDSNLDLSMNLAQEKINQVQFI